MERFSGKGFDFELGKKTYVMGILNFTPDSFSDGGRYFEPDRLIARALELESEGADILDLGACSTAPGNAGVSEEEELHRVGCVIGRLAQAVSVPVSIDTYRVSVAQLALENGACIVNDEGAAFCAQTARLVKAFDAGWIFMHTGGANADTSVTYPQGVTADVKRYFDACGEEALEFGICPRQLCFDPGIGFGKTRCDDRELIRNIRKLKGGGALLLGISGKRVIREACGVNRPEDALFGVCAANALCAAAGADIIRAHNVAAAVESVRVADIMRGG